MPSPFPGMDPWLENPAIFPDLHLHFIARLGDTINERLPAPYYAAVANRVWVDLSLRHIEPDVDVLYPFSAPRKNSPRRKGRSAIEVAEVPLVIDAPGLIENDDMEEPFLEIFAKPGNEQLVTELYLKKQEEILNSKANLVEIDLLRGGVPTTLVPRSLVEVRHGPFDYHVCIHRMDQKGKYYVHPWDLKSRLPVIQIPLVPGDPMITVDLQPILDETYDKGNYARRVHYQTEKPRPRLTREQKEWAEKILKSKRR
jgi:Protein of unknown function (DUF4058)